MPVLTAPDRSEAAEYYFTYINQVGPGNIAEILTDQKSEALDLLRGISDTKSLHRYAPDKWSIRESVAHVNDTERLFVFRAFWFARGLDLPLPSFDQDAAAVAARADDRPWKSHIEEFSAIRDATVTFFQNLPADTWTRRGIASDKPFSVRALAYITAGHLAHHLKILRERYL
jgi:hypothetical protein